MCVCVCVCVCSFHLNYSFLHVMQCDLSTVSIVKLLCLKMNKNNMYIRNYDADCVIKCVLQGNIINLSIILSKCLLNIFMVLMIYINLTTFALVVILNLL